MKFIWWTLVWFGLDAATRIALVYQMGWDKYYHHYPPEVTAISSIVNIILWIYLYKKFIEKSK